MSHFEVAEIVSALRAVRNEWRDSQGRPRDPVSRELPSREAMSNVVEQLKGALFPMRLGPAELRHESEDFFVGYTLHAALQALLVQVELELAHDARHAPAPGAESEDLKARALALTREFAAELPRMRRILDVDVLAAFQGDPAARSVDEVLLCYPGVVALIHHRIAHKLYSQGLVLLARMVSEQAHAQTGIDLHPGAQIDEGFFMDHGTGIVVGETAVIGKRVRLYQAVTLGAKRFPTDEHGNLQKGLPRHPLVEDDVVIYAGATILGRVTIGRGATIGGNVWITSDVPPGASVTQASLQSGRPVT
ncbi:serine acetyltransferase [Variovorax dokdonensis]|uniref:serine O-acetyltransferase n=1 Tax=Variovorax dokdonensis TaxID=344883 RepID=A0ABT7NH04_9BURK|nr:serine O-acetyltransferase EpsC [Variovorax dokdonensis]MDM0047224.1 serine acetyltransferase [Variovorax dokdonensis]